MKRFQRLQSKKFIEYKNSDIIKIKCMFLLVQRAATTTAAQRNTAKKKNSPKNFYCKINNKYVVVKSVVQRPYCW